MAVQRKRFRIERIQSGEMPILDHAEGDAAPHHHQIMSELRAIRVQMSSHHHSPVTDGENPTAQASVGDTLNRNTGATTDLLNGGRIRIRRQP